jgi:hypothetical protein
MNIISTAILAFIKSLTWLLEEDIPAHRLKRFSQPSFPSARIPCGQPMSFVVKTFQNRNIGFQESRFQKGGTPSSL